jgi:hypothetical protein
VDEDALLEGAIMGRGLVLVPPSRLGHGGREVRVGPDVWSALFVVVERGGRAPAAEVERVVELAAGPVDRGELCRRATAALAAVGCVGDFLIRAGEYLIG